MQILEFQSRAKCLCSGTFQFELHMIRGFAVDLWVVGSCVVRTNLHRRSSSSIRRSLKLFLHTAGDCFVEEQCSHSNEQRRGFKFLHHPRCRLHVLKSLAFHMQFRFVTANRNSMWTSRTFHTAVPCHHKSQPMFCNLHQI